MRRVWAAVLSVWALLALVAVLAWTRPPTPVVPVAAKTVIVHTPGGGRRVVVLAPPAHATTQTSPGAVQQPVAIPARGTGVTNVAPSAGNGN